MLFSSMVYLVGNFPVKLSCRKFDSFPLEVYASARLEQAAADLAEVQARHSQVANAEKEYFKFLQF